jgi:predicted lipoprotein with Yx(FWY)xxD motif
MGQLWDEAIVAYGNGTRVKDGEQYPINNPLSVWAVAFMIEKATARSGITNGVQEILITIPNQINEKGWYKTFQDNTGITLETFYTQFNSALSANDKSTRVSNLVTSNFASTVTGKYNYSVLQLTGADTSVNSGGTPSAAARTLYFYDNDTSTIPSYQGGYSGAWPYAVTSKNITKATEISASITKNANGNYVLVANKPVYQYASDTATSKSGATINLWKAIKPDGTGVDRTKIAP